MQVNKIQSNNTPAFNAMFKVKDSHGVLAKSNIDFLRSEAVKIGTDKDVINVKLGNYKYVPSWADQGWMAGLGMGSVDVNVESLINKEAEKNNFRCYGNYDECMAENVVNNIMVYFHEFADKLKK